MPDYTLSYLESPIVLLMKMEELFGSGGQPMPIKYEYTKHGLALCAFYDRAWFRQQIDGHKRCEIYRRRYGY